MALACRTFNAYSGPVTHLWNHLWRMGVVGFVVQEWHNCLRPATKLVMEFSIHTDKAPYDLVYLLQLHKQQSIVLKTIKVGRGWDPCLLMPSFLLHCTLCLGEWKSDDARRQ